MHCVFAGNFLQVRRGGEHLQGQVWGEPGDVGGEWLDPQTGPLRLVPVVLQVKTQVLLRCDNKLMWLTCCVEINKFLKRSKIKEKVK